MQNCDNVSAFGHPVECPDRVTLYRCHCRMFVCLYSGHLLCQLQLGWKDVLYNVVVY